MYENEPRKKWAHDPKLKWPILFKRFIDDSSGIFKDIKNEGEYWVEQFNTHRDGIKIDERSFGTRVKYMDVDIYNGPIVYECGKFGIR